MKELSFDINEAFEEMEEKLKEISERKKELEIQQSNYDKKIQDILHCAENYELDAFRGFKLYKILHDTMKERRLVKNELKILMDVFGSVSLKNIEKANNCIKHPNIGKKYHPRVVNELFDLLK